MTGSARGSKCVIVANGDAPNLRDFKDIFAGADYVVAADGGARALLRGDIAVNTVLGDFDSLEPDLLARWRATGGHTIRFPAEKDETDLELAVRHVLARGAGQIVILGALGGRIDHAMANVLLLASPDLTDCDACIRDSRTRIIAVHDAATLHGRRGDVVSLLPLTARVQGITTAGLAYGLADATLQLGPSRGVSNVLTGPEASVRITDGILLAIHTWDDTRPITW